MLRWCFASPPGMSKTVCVCGAGGAPPNTWRELWSKKFFKLRGGTQIPPMISMCDRYNGTFRILRTPIVHWLVVKCLLTQRKQDQLVHTWRRTTCCVAAIGGGVRLFCSFFHSCCKTGVAENFILSAGRHHRAPTGTASMSRQPTIAWRNSFSLLSLLITRNCLDLIYFAQDDELQRWRLRSFHLCW